MIASFYNQNEKVVKRIVIFLIDDIMSLLSSARCHCCRTDINMLSLQLSLSLFKKNKTTTQKRGINDPP